MSELNEFSPNFEKLELSEREKYLIEPFFTNVEKPTFAVTFLPPEVIGALCARTSRAKEDLRLVFLKEFVKPFAEEPSQYGRALVDLIDFLHKNPFELVFSNPKGREFYIKWLAQYGDDSIAQMAGTHLCYSALSQVAIKHFEDMRIGIAPLEKSTRFVDYSSKINGQYRYYIDPTLKEMGLEQEYKAAMDGLFDTYSLLNQKFLEYLKQKYPKEDELVLKTKTFDTIRGLLPVSTLSQVSFFGNGQAMEYLIARSLDNKLGEIRWAALSALEELRKVVPAFLRRVEDPASKDYRNYLSERGSRIKSALLNASWQKEKEDSATGVKLVDFDSDGENKVLSGLIYSELQEPFEKVLEKVKRLSPEDKDKILREVLKDRKARYYKIPRAFENVYLRFEITMNIGAWRDLHRHRMLTQFREKFSPHNGFDVPQGLTEAGLSKDFSVAILRAEEVFLKIEKNNVDLAQYACALAHRVRFVQYQNLRNFFWETELRTIAQGHPDYRRIEHEKVKLVQKIYPLISKYLLADMKEYDFARREVKIQIEKKEEELKKYFQK